MNFRKSSVVGSLVILAGILVGTFLLLKPTPAVQDAISGAKTQLTPAAAGGVAPILSGELISVMVWNRPVETSGSNSGGKYEGGRVDIYDRFIIVTRHSGEKRLVWNAYYTDLWFK